MRRLVQNVWSEVLRCVSRWELLQQLHSGGPTDALLFSPPPAESPASNPLMKLRDRLLMRSSAPTKHFGGQSTLRPHAVTAHQWQDGHTMRFAAQSPLSTTLFNFP